jgi:hypothetical protein
MAFHKFFIWSLVIFVPIHSHDVGELKIRHLLTPPSRICARYILYPGGLAVALTIGACGCLDVTKDLDLRLKFPSSHRIQFYIRPASILPYLRP